MAICLLNASGAERWRDRINSDPEFKLVARDMTLNLAIEVPLRFHRDCTAQPRRNGTPVEIFKIESTLRQSLDFVRQQLTSKTEDPLN